MARALPEEELLALVDALAAGQWCSGQALAEQGGVTRAALAKRIAHLREWGLAVQTQPGLGYRLESPLERLDAARIRAGLDPDVRARLRAVTVLPHIGSTNQQLLDAAPADDPQALLAERQTAGRGRRGRSWQSPFGSNLYFSLAWSFPAWPPQLGTVSLVVGVACAQVLRAAGIEAVMLKWPNDLRVGSAKLGGILIEQRGEAGGACRLVIGVGINVAMTGTQVQPMDQPWTTVDAERSRAGQPPVSRNTLASHLLEALVQALERFGHEGFAPFLPAWNALDATAGQAVRVLGVEPAIEGIARGIDADGALIVEAGGRRHHLHAGEVSLRLSEPAR